MNNRWAASIPTVRAITKELRTLNDYFDGPGCVALSYDYPRKEWVVTMTEQGEEIPGDGRHFDAVRVARRIRAAATDQGRQLTLFATKGDT